MTAGTQRGGLRTVPDTFSARSFIIRVYSLLATASLEVFGLLHFTGDNVTLGLIEIVAGMTILVNLGMLQATRNVSLAKHLFLLIVLALLVVMIITGGTQNTGIFWCFVFPVAAFFLVGTRLGAWWLGAILLTIVTLGIGAAMGILTISYPATVLRQLGIILAIVSLGIYAYQRSRENLERESEASQEALRSEQLRADFIVEHIDEGIVTTDVEGKVNFMNPAAEKILGWRESELMGKKFVEAVPSLDHRGSVISPESRGLSASLKEGKMMTVATYRSKQGKAVPVSVVGQTVKRKGKTAGGIVTFRDITDEQDMARAKSEFITLASHQLRTPISAISWLSELLLHGDAGKLGKEQQVHIEDIYHSNLRLANLVNEMLIVSSLDLGTLPITPQKIQLAKVASGVIKEQRQLQKAKKIPVTEKYDPDLPELHYDPDLIKLLLRHLLSNAFKYSPDGGRVAVQIHVDKKSQLWEGSEGSVFIAVKDSGYGIPQEATKKIFTKFFRAGNIIQKDTDGTGLGLYLVKSLLDYVGGRISFTSQEGKGTTFTVALPLEGMKAYKPHNQEVGKVTRQGMMAAKGGKR